MQHHSLNEELAAESIFGLMKISSLGSLVPYIRQIIDYEVYQKEDISSFEESFNLCFIE
jgi:hypothetical protein